jgi:CheY-like chemotaxis protein/tetratricopeptide (TPR) repeat protein
VQTQTAQISIAVEHGIAAAKAGNNTAARDMLLSAVEVQPNSEQAWFWLAYLANSPDDRHSHLRQILRINPAHPQARTVLKKSLLQAGIDARKKSELLRARDYFSEAAKLDPECEQSWLWLATVSTSYKEVMDCLGRVLEINPDNERARRWLNRPSVNQEAAAAVCTCPLCGFSSAARAERCFKCNSILTLSDIDAVIDNSDVDCDLVRVAIDRYTSIVSTTKSPSILFTIGLAYLNVKEAPEGLVYLKRASELQPDNEILSRQIEALERKLHTARAATVGEFNRPLKTVVGNGDNFVTHAVDEIGGPEGTATKAELPISDPSPKPHPGTGVHNEIAQYVWEDPARVIEQIDNALVDFSAAAQREGEAPPPDGSIIDDSLSPADKETEAVNSFAVSSSETIPHHPTRDVIAEPESIQVDQSEPATVNESVAVWRVEPEMTEGAAAPLLVEDADEREKKARSAQRVVLVVDDSATVRQIVAVTLEREGYRVLCAAGAMEAFARINEVMPDLMLLDIAMPHMDGYQLCKLIKANSLTKAMPVVMLSGRDGFFDKVRGKMTGATHYITKPFETSTLIEAVHKFCKRPVAA